MTKNKPGTASTGDGPTIVSKTATTSVKPNRITKPDGTTGVETTVVTKSTSPSATAALANANHENTKPPKKSTKKVHWETSGTGDQQGSPSGVEYGKYQPTPDMTDSLPKDWNCKRYQREDEEMWAPDLAKTGHKVINAIKNAGTSAGRFIESSLGKDAKENKEVKRPNTYTADGQRYFALVHPPVNDHHPPIIRQPQFKDTVQWMVQPPPAAKLMEGKVPVSRTSTSNGKRRAIAASDDDDSGSLRALTQCPTNETDATMDKILMGPSRPSSSASNRSNGSQHSKKSDCQPDETPVTLHDML